MAKQSFVTGQVLTAAQMTALQANDYNQTVSAKTANYVLVAADAGTRITMSNAGATTITVNTSLFTAGDTLFLTNIGAGATTITAGTATVSTASSLVLAQYDSGRLYFTSTGVAIWEKYQGASSAAVASWSQLGVSATTSGSTVTVSGLSGYNQLFFSFENISSSGTNAVYTLRVNADSGANYNYSNYTIRNTPATVSGGYTAGDSSFYLARIATAANTMVGGVLMTGSNGTGKKFMQGFSATVTDITTSDITNPNIYGTYDGTSVISSVSILTSGTAFDLGNIRVFGSVV